jgi:hypothetical protein
MRIAACEAKITALTCGAHPLDGGIAPATPLSRACRQGGARSEALRPHLAMGLPLIQV